MKNAQARPARVLGLAFSFAIICSITTSPAHAEPFAYVTNLGTSSVSVIDTTTNTVTTTVTFGTNPVNVAIAPDGAFAYVTNQNSNIVSVIDTSSNSVITTVGVGTGPVGITITPDGAFAYVTNRNSNSVSVIDTTTNTVTTTVIVGTNPVGIKITPDGAFAYVTNFGSGNVSVIDTSNNTVTATVIVGTSPFGVAITPDGTFAYVANIDSNNVSVINTTSNTVTATVTGGSYPRSVAITPDGAFAYVTNQVSNNVSVIDTSSNTVTATVAVGSNPIGVAITREGAFAYVANLSSSTVSVIDLATNTVTAMVTVGGSPLDVAIGGGSTSTNLPPTAQASDDVIAAVGHRVEVNGLQSFDAESATLSLQFAWTVATSPVGSTAGLEDDGIGVATAIVPDIPGEYVIQLVVTDEGGLQSTADSVTLTAEIFPAFVFERRTSGDYTYVYGQNRYQATWDYWYPSGLAAGRPYGTGYAGQYFYDWNTGSYAYDHLSRLGWLDSTGQDTLVSTGDPMPGTSGTNFRDIWAYGRSGTTLGFWGWGINPAGNWVSGDFRVTDGGSVTQSPRAPFSIAGDTETLSQIWHSWHRDNDLALVYGSKGRYALQERTVSYKCGTDSSQTCTYTYTYYQWHYGIYVLDGSAAVKIVDTDMQVPGFSSGFEGFGDVDRDPLSGTVVFVGWWFGDDSNWHQGLFKKPVGGPVEKLLDDRDQQFAGGGIGGIEVDGDVVYLGGHRYQAGEFEQDGGGYKWWSSYQQGIFQFSDGELTPAVQGGAAWFQQFNPEFYAESYAYSVPDTWNFGVDQGVLAFPAWSYFYTYNSSTGLYEYSHSSGVYWREGGQIRAIAQGGESLDGRTYQWVSGACCDGNLLESRTALLFAASSTYTFDSAAQESTYADIYDTILARFDSDRDRIGDDLDNCRLRPNADQLDSDGDDIGDPCEDTDRDGTQDFVDNCPFVPNDQSDSDGDGPGNACDACPLVSDSQADQDGDGIGDACDNDLDSDSFANDIDNCPNTPNDQINKDGDLLGDACDPDIDGDGIANAVDGIWDSLTYTDSSQVASKDFSDHALGGRSFGRIASSGQLIILVEDAPGADEGLLISAVNGSGNATVKQCDFQGKTANLRLEQGSVVTVTCGSLSVRALGRGAQLVLDDDVLIDVQQQMQARVVGLGQGEFRVENHSQAPFPIAVNLGQDVEVTIPTASTCQIAEPAPGQYEIHNPVDGAQPIRATTGGITLVYAPGDIGVPVRVSIKPDSIVNTIKVGSGGVYPTAILSSATFDATRVDPLSVTLASAPVKLTGQGRAIYSIKDVNGDGRNDILLQIETSAMILNSAVAQLRGVTVDGVAIFGSDVVKVVK